MWYLVQKNIVNYIIQQIKVGKKLEEITLFLINSGYSKDEVESSAQYVINLQQSPQIAANQRIQQLTQYIAQQRVAGYTVDVIKNFLVSKGYPYYEVDSAIKLLQEPQREVRKERKLGMVAAIMIILILCIGGGFYYKLFVEIQKPPSRLLDVETEKITTIPQLGGELIFQINLVNFGEINMYDVLLRYSIFQGDNKVVISKEETVAISTTLQKVVKLNIPKTISAGQYILKVEAIYGNFTATSGFIFEIAAEEEVERIVKEVRKKYAVNDTNETKEEGEEVIKAVQNITEEIIKHSIKPVTIKPKKKVSPFEGMTRAQSHQLVKMISVREPDRAVKMCKIFEVDSN